MWVFLTRLPLPLPGGPGTCEVLALEVDTLEDALTKRFGRPASRWLKELEEVRSTGPGLGHRWWWLVGGFGWWWVGFGGSKKKT